jgi:UDP-glucose 4-epimerase
MAKVLATGGAGYVGSICCAELLRLGHSVTVVDDLSTGFRESVPAGAAFVQLDLGDRAGMESLLRGATFDVVFHFAARALIPESVSDPGVFFQQNVAAGITLLEALRAARIRNFVFSSSAAIYGTPPRTPIDEDDPKQPVNSYGTTKLMFEQVLESYARAYGWSVIAFRYFNAAGATAELGERHDPETHLIPLLLEAATGERESCSLYGDDYETPDGTCLRDYVHVLDIARAHVCGLQALGPPRMRAYNIGLGTSYSVGQVWQAAEQVSGRTIPVRVEGRRAGDPPVLCANPRRIMQELGWRPEHSSLQEIIGSAWEWKRQHTRAKVALGVP